MTDIIQDEGIIINLRAHGESSAIISVLSASHGLISGYVKAARTKKNSGTYQKGNVITFEHTRKSQDYLGYITAEPLHCLWVILSEDRFSFAIFNSLCDIMFDILQSNISETLIYNQFNGLIHILTHNDDIQASQHMCYFLLIFLSETGFAPDLKRCAATGSTEELIYLSPKSGRAISQSAGEIYKDRLMALPAFLTDSSLKPSWQEINDGAKVCGFLLEKFLFHPKNKTLPASFYHLYTMIQKNLCPADAL